MVIYGIDVSVAVDQLFHHALHSEPGCQDQWSSTIVHAGIQFCGTITNQDLRE